MRRKEQEVRSKEERTSWKEQGGRSKVQRARRNEREGRSEEKGKKNYYKKAS